MVILTVTHYVWILGGSSLTPRVVLSIIKEQHKLIDGIAREYPK